MVMQQILLRAPGSIDNLAWQETNLSPPAAHEVQIRHEAIGVNFIDIYHRTGLYPQPSYPAGLGVEGAGTIAAVGSAVKSFRPGQRVAYVAATPGSYATHRNLPADRLVLLPDWLDSATAAAVLLQWLTAEFLSHAVHEILPGEAVLLHAAAGGVGLLLAQWAATNGATVIGTVGSMEKEVIAKAHGCRHVINYRTEDFVARVKELTKGEGVHVVYDSVGATTFDGSLQALRPRGIMVSYGQASGSIPPFEISRLVSGGSLYLTRPSLFHYIATPEELQRRAAHLFLVLKAGTLKAPPITRFALAEAGKAQTALESRETAGKIILLP